MYELFFFLVAALTVFLSIKLSYYADILSNQSKVSKALIGGILLAGITSLPEFVTCLSAVFMKNPYLAVGDILGSNFFNLFIVAFFDLFFIKRMLFNHLKKYHLVVYFLLIVNYLVYFLFVSGILNSIFLGLSIPTIVTFITYFIYLRFASSSKEEEENIIVTSNSKYIGFKITITAILMVLSSILLTFIVNKIAFIYPKFSSSLFGALLLGITTSLPEVITFYTLFSLKNYDLSISNIVGSNLFNLFVLSVSDLFLANYSVYQFFDKESLLLLKLGCFSTIVSLIHLIYRSKFKVIYLIFSFIVILFYMFFLFYQFNS